MHELIGYGMIGEVIARKYICTQLTDGLLVDVWLVQPGVYLDGWAPLCVRGISTPGVYIAAVGSRVVTRTGSSLVVVPDPTRLNLLVALHNKRGLVTLANRVRLRMHDAYQLVTSCCCSTVEERHYVYEEVYRHVIRERFPSLADSLSNRNMRAGCASCVKEFPHISTDSIRTSLFACLFQECMCVNSNPEVDASELIVPMGEYTVFSDNRFDPSGYKFLSAETMEQKPVFRDNGLVELKSAVGISYDDKGLHFQEPYEGPEEGMPFYLVGPHVSSAMVMYSVKSTANQEAAFIRLTNSRAREQVYRCYQDIVMASLFGVFTVYPPATRELAKKFKCFAGWGVPFTRLRKTYLALSPNEQRRIDFAAANISRLMSSMRHRMLDFDVEHNGVVLRDAHVHAVNELAIIGAQEYAEKPHPKRQLRIDAMQVIWDNPNYRLLYKREKPELKVKWEVAKTGKVPRQFVSLGDIATMHAPHIPDLLKKMMNKPITTPVSLSAVGNLRARDVVTALLVVDFVATPQPGRLDACFNQHAEYHASSWRDSFLSLVHSDDSVITFNCFIGNKRCVVSLMCDIAKCDLSHGPCMFLLLEELARSVGLSVEELVVQCMQDVIINHPNPTLDDYAIFTLLYPVLLSGSTLTTCLNTLVCNVIMVAITLGILLRPERRFESVEDLVHCVHTSVAFVGYEITCDVCTTFHDGGVESEIPMSSLNLSSFTFLKFFPCWSPDRGGYVAVPCLGRLLRSFGLSDTDVVDRVGFCSNVVRTFLTCHSCACFDDLSRFVLDVPHMELPLSESGAVIFDLGIPAERCVFTDESLCARYGCSVTDLRMALEMMFSDLRPCLVYSPTLLRVLTVDYGLMEG